MGLASIGQSKNTEMEKGDDGKIIPRTKWFITWRRVGAIARIHYNISKVTIPKKMKNTHEKLLLSEKIFAHITLTKNLFYLLKNIFYNLLQMVAYMSDSFVSGRR